jgi:hypothetical protein
MTTPRRGGAVPWIVAGAAGVLLAALLLTYFAFLVPDKKNSTDVGGLTHTEQVAVSAAGTRAVNLISFRRAQFNADWARAVNGTTGALKTQITAKRAATLSSLQKGKFDIGATVTHASLEGPTVKGAKGYLVLVSVNGYHLDAKSQTVPQSLEVTVVRQHGQWLASDVEALNFQ